MSHDNSLGAPAGWYADPLGHPQMRWWTGEGWTEQVSAAPEPLVIQGASVTWQDEEPAAVAAAVPSAASATSVALIAADVTPVPAAELETPPAQPAEEPVPVFVPVAVSTAAPYTKYAQSNWQAPVLGQPIVTGLPAQNPLN